jgi:hypothetical protein
MKMQSVHSSESSGNVCQTTRRHTSGLIPSSPFWDAEFSVLLRILCDYRQGPDWWYDFLATCTHHSEQHVITPPSLISTLHKSPQHPPSLFPASYIFNSRSLATASNSGDSLASRAHVVTVWRISRNWTPVNCQLYYSAISSQPPVQNSTRNWKLTTDWVAAIVFKITPLHGPHTTHPRFHCCSPTVAAA